MSGNANGGNNLKTGNSIQSLSDEALASDTADSLSGSFTDVPGTTNTKSKTLAIIYTCKVCDTRSAKQFTEHSYRHGVVLVRCPGCQNLHLIADRLGWFEDQDDDGEGWDVEKALSKAGENVKAVSHGDVLELTLDDVMGGNSS
jgi:protein import protein ZIM17